MFNDWNETLYQYYKEVGGCFTGDVGSNYQECRLTLEYEGRNITLEPVIRGVGNDSLNIRARAIMSVQMERPLTMTIQPYGIVKKAVELVMKEDIATGDPNLDKLYLIRGSEPDFIKLILNGSRLAELLVHRKDVDISVKPVHDNEPLHMVQAVSKGGVTESFVGMQWDITSEQFAKLAELCYETWRAVTDYRIV